SLFQDPAIVAGVVHGSSFEAIHVDPYVDDVGAANGAALHVTHVIEAVPCKRERVAEDSGRLEPVAEDAQRSVIELGDEQLIAAAAEALASGQLVAWVQDAPEVEVRPRGRSVILCDPARAEAVLRLRREVKLGEGYVPLGVAAPSPTVARW